MPFSAPRPARIALGASYSGLAAAGAWFVAEPSGLLQSSMGTVIYGWALFLVIGGLLCLVGTVTKLWIGEFTGLVLLWFGNFAWAVVLVGAAFSPTAGNTSAKYGLTLLSLSMAAFAYRWLEIREKVRSAAAIERHKAKRRRRKP